MNSRRARIGNTAATIVRCWQILLQKSAMNGAWASAAAEASPLWPLALEGRPYAPSVRGWAEAKNSDAIDRYQRTSTAVPLEGAADVFRRNAEEALPDRQRGNTMLLIRLGMGAVAVAVMMLFLDAASADIKIGNKSQFAQSTSRSPKATTATRGRPQVPAFRPGRFIIKN